MPTGTGTDHEIRYTKRPSDDDISNIVWFLQCTCKTVINITLSKTKWCMYIRSLIDIALHFNPFISSLTIVCKNKTQRIIRSQDTLNKVRRRVNVMKNWFITLAQDGLTKTEKYSSLEFLREYIECGVVGVTKYWDLRISLAMYFCRILESLETVDCMDYYVPVNSHSTFKNLDFHRKLVQCMLDQCQHDAMKVRIHFQVSTNLTKAVHQKVSSNIVRVFKTLLTKNKQMFQSLTISDMEMYKKVYFLLHSTQ